MNTFLIAKKFPDLCIIEKSHFINKFFRVYLFSLLEHSDGVQPISRVTAQCVLESTVRALLCIKYS